MPRDILQSDRNKLTIKCQISGENLDLYYRLPTTEERAGCMSAKYKRVGNKVFNRSFRVLAHYGGLIVTGIGEGQFAAGADGEGNPKLISSDKKSPDYFPKWKEHLRATCGDLLIILGQHVFEGRIEIPKEGFPQIDFEDPLENAGDDLGPVAEEAGEETRPLPKSSGGSKKSVRRSKKKSAPEGADPS